MENFAIRDGNQLDTLLAALEEEVQAAGAAFDLVVIGGTALNALGLLSRPTKDVDLLGELSNGEVKPLSRLPAALVAAADRVASVYGLQRGWLNAGPSDLTGRGLPAGFERRLVARTYGPALTVHFASREDQIHFKLYAMVDQGGGRHEADLRALAPSPAELLRAASGAITHDVSVPFRSQLEQALAILGVEDADLGS